MNISFKKEIIHLFEKSISANFLFFFKVFLFKSRFIHSSKTTIYNNVSIINTFQLTGGAAKVASTLFDGLNTYFNIHYYVKKKQSLALGVIEIQQNEYSFFPELLRREAIKKGWVEFTGFHALNLLKDSFFQESNLVHLHNLHGEFFSPGLFSTILKDKKVLWTLHDERILTGHCSCTLSCERWKQGCGNCPDLTIYPPVYHDQTNMVLKEMKSWITNLNPIIVCPSNWLAERVKIAYPKLEQIMVVHNGVDTTIFRPYDKLQSRKKLNLPNDRKIILFVAEFSTKNPFKGGDIIRNLISDIDLQDYIFITIGGDDDVKFNNHISYPYIQDQDKLAILYSSCDVLMYPTRADNLPMVILESMACELPVISSNLGGIPEIIQDKFDGFLIDDFRDSTAFKNCLINFFEINLEEHETFKKRCRVKILSSFTKEIMIERYLNIYRTSLR
jgi:glycosyltransferase involved in cell wall biosynthesis